jgi:chitin disaccharide deacetylase
MSKRLTLCADDFAQSRAISSGILQLLASGRLSATSVMSQSSLWPELAPALKALAAQVDVGLHFNLTHPFTASARPLPYWLLRSQLGLLSRSTLREQWLAQIDSFSAQLGQLPDFIDGHQHVHALPVVREAMFEAIEQRWTGRVKPYLRAPDRLAQRADSAAKAVLLKALCRGFSARAQALGYVSNAWFGGLYSLTSQADFVGLMQQWLRACPSGGLMMCHPGLPASDPDDPIGGARGAEYAYLASAQFAEDCLLAGIEIGRFQAL